ncbi:alpha/beta hydrolase [Parvularcula dongshanensis]|uniref:Pimeloyl-ACP methyl ester carboxylesterase n=1 Tax=Parvularcula dongshanensis TaxID=1173995 RepID=A0A840I0F5_9PROT|nr:alpha/beta hydrolase [Parvularcula dongshanensis]MBB4657724.1 pimeloyl-ACP methyl ester carboxylesterase [Parvularcula dongshanensis]
MGAAAPRVLFDAGAFGLYVDGANLVRALAARGVAAASFTRAGLYGSDPLPEGGVPSPAFHAGDMARLLGAVGAAGPVVLVGHSMASLRLFEFAGRHPQRVRGLVLVDGVVPDGGPVGPALTAFSAACAPITPVLPSMARWAKYYPNAMALSGRERADKLASITSQAHWRAARREVREAARAKAPPVPRLPTVLMPATIISAGTSRLARRTEASLQELRAWGHASVLSPGPCGAIAEAAHSLL